MYLVISRLIKYYVDEEIGRKKISQFLGNVGIRKTIFEQTYNLCVCVCVCVRVCVFLIMLHI